MAQRAISRELCSGRSLEGGAGPISLRSLGENGTLKEHTLRRRQHLSLKQQMRRRSFRTAVTGPGSSSEIRHWSNHIAQVRTGLPSTPRQSAIGVADRSIDGIAPTFDRGVRQRSCQLNLKMYGRHACAERCERQRILATPSSDDQVMTGFPLSVILHKIFELGARQWGNTLYFLWSFCCRLAAA